MISGEKEERTDAPIEVIRSKRLDRIASNKKWNDFAFGVSKAPSNPFEVGFKIAPLPLIHCTCLLTYQLVLISHLKKQERGDKIETNADLIYCNQLLGDNIVTTADLHYCHQFSSSARYA